MTNFSLYRKEIEMLEITKQLFLDGQYHGGYRESIAELFYENNEHFRQEFLEIIPVENLENTKELLFFLKTVNSSSQFGRRSTISSMYRGERDVQDVITDITKLQDMIRTECNGAVALRISAQLLFMKKITARPRKYLAVGVKLMYDQTH